MKSNNPISKLILLICLMCMVIFSITSVYAEDLTIILNDGNSFTDTLDDGSSIFKKTANDPIEGNNIEFSCGECGVADFNDAVSQIGGKSNICGYTSQVPQKLISNDDKICARSLISGRMYDIDLLTWSAQGKCFDNDNGASCSEFSNQFAYARSEKFIPLEFEIKVGSKTERDIQNKAYNYEISNKAKSNDIVKVSIRIENGFTDDTKIESSVEIIIKNIDDGDDLEDSDKINIKSGDKEDFEFEFEIPDKIDDDTYHTYITLVGETNDGKIFTIVKDLTLEIEKETHDLRITRDVLYPSSIKCDKFSNLDLEITNYGKSKEDKVKIIAYSNLLGFYYEFFKNGEIELDTGTDNDAVYPLDIPVIINTTKTGIFPITIEVYRDEDKLADTQDVNLLIEKCTETIVQSKDFTTNVEIKNNIISNTNLSQLNNNSKNNLNNNLSNYNNSSKNKKENSFTQILEDNILVISSICILIWIILILLILIKRK